MGRRKKAAKKAVKKKRPTVAKVFKCLFCNHDKSVTCNLDIKTKVGELSCSVCDATYKTHIHDLSEPIDVFTEWLDETADAQAKAAKKYAQSSLGDSPHHLQERVERLFEDDLDEEDIAAANAYDDVDDD